MREEKGEEKRVHDPVAEGNTTLRARLQGLTNVFAPCSECGVALLT